VVMGDNGGPLNNGHDNGPFRGGKLNWWEGGVRPFAFISSPLLRSSPLLGGWFNHTVHETDWCVESPPFHLYSSLYSSLDSPPFASIHLHQPPFNSICYRFATFASLAQAPLPTSYDIDGKDLWPALQTGQPHREEALIGDNILRQGRYKLIAGGGFNQTEGAGWQRGAISSSPQSISVLIW